MSKWDAAITDPVERAKFDRAVVYAREVGSEEFMGQMQSVARSVFSSDEMLMLMGGLAAASEAFDQPFPEISFAGSGSPWQATLCLSLADNTQENPSPTT